MKHAALFLVVVLSACGWDMNAHAWGEATRRCESHGGLVAADYRQPLSAVDALCADSTILQFHLPSPK